MAKFVRACPVCREIMDVVDVERLGVADLPDGRRIYAQWDRRHLILQLALDKFDDFVWLQWNEVKPGALFDADVECRKCSAAGLEFNSFVTRQK